MVPRNLNDSTAVTVLFMMVSGGRAGGVLLKSTIISTVLSVLRSRLLRLHQSQLLNLLSVSRLITVLDEANQCGVVCKLQELDRGVFRCAVILCFSHCYGKYLFSNTTEALLNHASETGQWRSSVRNMSGNPTLYKAVLVQYPFRILTEATWHSKILS